MSFRGGGEKIFYERLKGSMTQRKWLLHSAPPIPKSNRDSPVGGSMPGSSPGLNGNSPAERVKIAGIAGLEHRGQAMRKNNELVIGSAFEDLEALMASARRSWRLRRISRGRVFGQRQRKCPSCRVRQPAGAHHDQGYSRRRR